MAHLGYNREALVDILVGVPDGQPCDEDLCHG